MILIIISRRKSMLFDSIIYKKQGIFGVSCVKGDN